MTGFQLVLQLVEQFDACTSIQGQRFEYCTSLSTVFRLPFEKKKLLKTAMILFFMIQAEDLD